MNTLLLVGHRGTGKTTLCNALPEPLFRRIDLDEEIERATGKSPAELISENENSFRDIETHTLLEIVKKNNESNKPLVMSVGAGCQDLPTENTIIVWIYRSGWIEHARTERDRLRPDMSFEEEVAWMRAIREPLWKKRAHLKFEISEGRRFDRIVKNLTISLQSLLEIPSSPFIQTTWIVASDFDLERAMNDVELLGFKGVECRNDLVQHMPDTTAVLASLRKGPAHWIDAQGPTSMLDIDIKFIDEVLALRYLDELEPRPLLLSCHPNRVDPIDVQQLIAAGRQIEKEHSDWMSLSFKYAPKIETFDQLGFAQALIQPLQNAGLNVTFLPQGERFRFYRILNFFNNFTNYIPARLNSCSAPEFNSYDLQQWLPYLFVNKNTTFRALIGNPVEGSQGDIWHGATYRERNQNIAYLKIPMMLSEVEEGLAQLRALSIFSLSVTSPLKKKFAIRKKTGIPRDYEIALVDTPEETIRFANTLQWTNGHWIGTDTDYDGMRAALEEIQNTGIAVGTIALYGKGDVTRAVRAAISDAKWKLVYHTGAREGWIDPPSQVTLVINASGKEAFEGACIHEAWLDLHYGNTKKGSKHPYFNGDTFYEAQAEAQIAFWESFEKEK